MNVREVMQMTDRELNLLSATGPMGYRKIQNNDGEHYIAPQDRIMAIEDWSPCSNVSQAKLLEERMLAVNGRLYLHALTVVLMSSASKDNAQGNTVTAAMLLATDRQRVIAAVLSDSMHKRFTKD